MTLEVCVDSLESLKIAIKAGADRIELCSALSLGGLTPSYGLMQRALDYIDREIFVMVRPRSGDFLYSPEDYEVMKGEIELIKSLGFHGIVVGFLKEDGRLDLARLEEVVKLARPLKVALHRAFDDAKNPEEDIEELIGLGLVRILSSGQRPRALEGAGFLASLERDYGSRIQIMPGSGVSADNIEELVELTGCKSYHMSARSTYRTAMEDLSYTRRMETPEGELFTQRADFDKIRGVREILDRLGRKR